MNTKLITSTIFCLALTVFPHMSFPNMTFAATDPCDEAAAKLCPAYRGKDPRKYYCLQKVNSQVTPACKQDLAKVTDTLPEYISDCSEDFHRFCEQTVPGEGRIVGCLKQHSKDLGIECRKRIAKAP